MQDPLVGWGRGGIWAVDSQENHSKCCYHVRFKDENAPKSISAGAPPKTLLGEFTALPGLPSWI